MLGNEDGLVQARYSHVTAAMRRVLVDGLTGMWDAALDARRPMAPGSPVMVLDQLLAARRQKVVGVNYQDRLPVGSPGVSESEIRTSVPVREAGPDLRFHSVGVAGFEPTTSSSRTTDLGKLTCGDVLVDVLKLSRWIRGRPGVFGPVVTHFASHLSAVTAIGWQPVAS
jgi:hypothetical protein